MTQEDRDRQDKVDMETLVATPEFKRFLFRVIQSSGIFTRTTDGSVKRSPDYFEGRRNLGLDILDMAESGQPIAATSTAGPLLTLIQTMIAETNQPATETQSGKRNSDRYDRNADLGLDATDDD